MDREQAIERVVRSTMADLCSYQEFIEDCVREHVELWTNGQINDYFNETVITE